MVMIPTKEADGMNFHNLLGSVYNLRKELARQIRLVRKGAINVAEALENTRDLVTYCHDSIIDDADRLQHKIMNQITKQYGKLSLKKRGLEYQEIRTPGVKTRDYLPSIKLNNRIG